MKCSLARCRHTAGAIRPLDVAAIVCVVGVLAFFAVLGAGRFKEHAYRLRCQDNLRQISDGLQLYSKANGGLLPDCSSANPQFYGSIWPWDLSANLAGILQTNGVTRDAFYCPANPELNDTTHWNYGGGVEVRIISYGMLFNGIGGVPRNLWPTDWKGDGTTPPSQTELMFDATACVNGDFSRIQGSLTDRSNHVRGKRALGGNILFLDQHVAWRDFSEMKMRFGTPGMAGTVSWYF